MIYFARLADRDQIKIGTTIRLSDRLVQLRYEYGTEIQLLAVVDGSFKEEGELHDRFAHLCVIDELFRPEDDLMEFIGAEGKAWDGTDEVPRKYTAALRCDAEAIRMARMAAGMMGIPVAEYVSRVLEESADEDIAREAQKLVDRFKA